MKIFTDLHHGDLFFSLHLLFEQRLGWELYRPIGLDWFTSGYWKIAEPYGNAMDTVGQYLDINSEEYDQYKNLNGNHYLQDNVYYIYDPGHDYYQKAITFETFKDMEFDIVMPSIHAHERPYAALKDLYQKQAKLVAHLGNGGQRTFIKNVIYSIPYIPSSDQNAVFVHQEIDPNQYTYTNPNVETKNIYSMVNCLPYPHIYNQYKNMMPDIQFKAYGASCPDGALSGSKAVAKIMQEANIGWQLKPLGGLGHTAMGWFASGRPLITNMSEHRKTGGLALSLFEPGVTCIDIESSTAIENTKLIKSMLEDNQGWSTRVRQKFDEVFNYNRDEAAVRKMLERIL